MRTDQRLREINVGSWEGLTIDEALASVDPAEAARYLAGEDVRRSPTGETVAEVATRAAEALEEIGSRAESGSTVIVVMMGWPARSASVEWSASRTTLGGRSEVCTTVAGSVSSGIAAATTGGSATTTLRPRAPEDLGAVVCTEPVERSVPR